MQPENGAQFLNITFIFSLFALASAIATDVVRLRSMYASL